LQKLNSSQSTISKNDNCKISMGYHLSLMQTRHESYNLQDLVVDQ
jgi:hypothetical protein